MLIAGLDLETTGLVQADGHRIIEVCFAIYDYPNRVAIKKFVQRIDPQRNIDAKAFAVHGIAVDDLKGCPTWDKVAPSLAKLMGAVKLVVAHNGDEFDIPFILNEFMRVGVPIPEVETFDTMLQGRWATPVGKIPNLGELCTACDVEYDASAAHSADYDVDVMMDCFFRGVEWGIYDVPLFKTLPVAA